MNLTLHLQSACLCMQYLRLVFAALSGKDALPLLLRAHDTLKLRRQLLMQKQQAALSGEQP